MAITLQAEMPGSCEFSWIFQLFHDRNISSFQTVSLFISIFLVNH
jgi:hypothetical protein